MTATETSPGGVLLLEREEEFSELLTFYLLRKGFRVQRADPQNRGEWVNISGFRVVVLSHGTYRRYSESVLRELRAANPFFRVILLYEMEESGTFNELNDPNIFGYFEKPLLRYRDMFLLTVRNADHSALLQARLSKGSGVFRSTDGDERVLLN